MMLFSRRQSMFLLVSFLSSTLVTVAAGPSAKRWQLLPLSVPSLEASDLPEIAAGEGVVAVIASPDTPSAFVAGGGEIDVDDLRPRRDVPRHLEGTTRVVEHRPRG